MRFDNHNYSNIHTHFGFDSLGKLSKMICKKHMEFSMCWLENDPPLHMEKSICFLQIIFESFSKIRSFQYNIFVHVGPETRRENCWSFWVPEISQKISPSSSRWRWYFTVMRHSSVRLWAIRYKVVLFEFELETARHPLNTHFQPMLLLTNT